MGLVKIRSYRNEVLGHLYSKVFWLITIHYKPLHLKHRVAGIWTKGFWLIALPLEVFLN